MQDLRRHLAGDVGQIDEGTAAGAAAYAGHQVDVQRLYRLAGHHGPDGAFNGILHPVDIHKHQQTAALADAAGAIAAGNGVDAEIQPGTDILGHAVPELVAEEGGNVGRLHLDKLALLCIQHHAAGAGAGVHLFHAALVGIKSAIGHVRGGFVFSVGILAAGHIDQTLGLQQRVHAGAARSDHQAVNAFLCRHLAAVHANRTRMLYIKFVDGLFGGI